MLICLQPALCQSSDEVFRVILKFVNLLKHVSVFIVRILFQRVSDSQLSFS